MTMRKPYNPRPIVLDNFASSNMLRAGLDEIHRLRGKEDSILQPTRLLPWFWSTARNSAQSPEEYEFVEANEQGFDEGLQQGHAILDPTLTDGLTSIVTRDAGLWPDGEVAVIQASKSFRNLWWLGLADPFIRSYAMSKLGPIAGPAALAVFDRAKKQVVRKSRARGLRRLRLITPLPPSRGPRRKERNGKEEKA